MVEGRPRVGVWLMPDNQNPGQLEDLVAAMIPAEDVVWRLAQEFVDRIPEPERPKPAIKAQVHAWLAARAAARRMGSAIRTGHLDASSPAATSFIRWLPAYPRGLQGRVIPAPAWVTGLGGRQGLRLCRRCGGRPRARW
ncbi:MAG: hypothetical protein F4Z23_12040 [Acidimicrobiaceae bacterium]|nr:hypothetical protein [Acidimicrobiaceae bacterium]